MVLSTVLVIALIRHTEDGIGSIQPDAALKATGCDVSAMPLHDDLVDEVIVALMKMGKAIDLFA
jgi:hypothetical protein